MVINIENDLTTIVENLQSVARVNFSLSFNVVTDIFSIISILSSQNEGKFLTKFKLVKINKFIHYM